MRTLAMATIMLMGMVSCSANIDSPSSGKLRIKVAEATDSEGIEKMDIFIFNEIGALEKEATIDLGQNVPSAETELSVKTGTKDIYILANMESSLSSIATVSDLMSGRISMGDKGFNGGSLPMSGTISGVKVISSNNNSCSTPLKRFPSRVHIGTLINEMECSLSDIRFRLSNGAGDCGFSESEEPSVWFNKIYSLGSDITAPEDIVLEEDLAGGGKLTINECLFCFPNHTANDTFSGNSFTPRKTRLVMSSSISGRTYYYPVTFDSIDRNTSYSVNLVIRNLGSSDPDIPISSDILSAVIVPLPWYGPFTIEETL